MNPEALGQTITAVIPILVPLLVALLKIVATRLPKKYLPLAAMVLGVALDALNGIATGHAAGPVWGLALGGLGVAVREAVDQFKKGGAS